MSKLLAALAMEPPPQPPVWVMRQAGRYLPEYREVRARHSFQEVVRTPKLAAEVTLQPIRRFGMDGAVIFADIMTPLEAMGVEMSFDPGPKLEPLTLAEVADLPDLPLERAAHVGETVERVKEAVPSETAVIGFCGGPVTLLAYLLEGGGSRDFMTMRGAIRSEPDLAVKALDRLGQAMNSYLRLQVDSGADVIQVFDTWAGMFDRETFSTMAVPSARNALEGVGSPSIYFAPGAGHALDLQPAVGATGYGIDWRTPIGEAFEVLAGNPVQGNLDPAILLTDPDTVRREVKELLSAVRVGHIVNLGHGIDRRTPPENLAAMVEAVRS